PPPETANVGDEPPPRPRPERPPVVRLHRAVLAGMGAPPREEHRPEEVHAVEPAGAEGVGLEQGQAPRIDGGKVAQVVPALGAIDALRAPRLAIGQEGGPS